MSQDPQQLSFWPRQRLDRRLEIRLDAERRRKIAELAQARGVPIAQVVRDLVDAAYDERQSTDGAGADPPR